MFRRRTFLGAALGASFALGLAACNSDTSGGSAAGDGGASDGGGGVTLAQVRISGAFGEEPVVEFTPPLSVESADSIVVAEGDGEAIAEGDTIILHSLYVDGASGETLQSWWQGAPASVITLSVDEIGQSAFDFFTSVTVGSRIAMSGWQTNLSGQMISLVQVADIVGKALPRANGRAVEPAELPAGVSVTLGEDGAPTVEGVTSIQTPDTTQRILLLEGEGEPTAVGENLVMHYTGWQTSDGTQFDSSWERGVPFTFELGSSQVIAGWDQNLEGLPVGSQVMLIIPPAEAYGVDAAANPLGGQTLVFVVDVLARAETM